MPSGEAAFRALATATGEEYEPVAAAPARRAVTSPEGACLEDGDLVVNNVQFAGHVGDLAARLSRLGVGAGATVAVMLPNCAEIVTTLFSAWWCGAALTPVNPALTDDEALYQLRDSGTRVLVSDERGAALADELGIAWIDASTVHAGAATAMQGDASEGDDTVCSLPDPDGNALIIYTSGTTGRPKGCVLNHRNIDAMVDGLIRHFQLTEQDRSLLVLPLFHCNGLLISVLSALVAGGSVVVAPRFDAKTFWDAVERHRPTYFSAVPTMYALVDAHTRRDVDTASLRFVACGGAPMPRDLIGRIEERFGVVLLEGYGLSECSVAATFNPIDGPRKPGTVGVPLPGQRVEIEHEGIRVPQGSRGEVVISGPNLMRGYLGKPEETAMVLKNGWLHTGDVGYLDEDGYLVLVDRLKDMIIRGGENIYPKEIESVLYEHPAVLEAAVVGKPDDIYGEVPVAYVAIRSGATASAEDLREHCLSRLAKYKTPREFVFLDSLPKNSVGKLTKGALRQAAASLGART